MWAVLVLGLAATALGKYELECVTGAGAEDGTPPNSTLPCFGATGNCCFRLRWLTPLPDGAEIPVSPPLCPLCRGRRRRVYRP